MVAVVISNATSLFDHQPWQLGSPTCAGRTRGNHPCSPWFQHESAGIDGFFAASDGCLVFVWIASGNTNCNMWMSEKVVVSQNILCAQHKCLLILNLQWVPNFKLNHTKKYMVRAIFGNYRWSRKNIHIITYSTPSVEMFHTLISGYQYPLADFDHPTSQVPRQRTRRAKAGFRWLEKDFKGASTAAWGRWIQPSIKDVYEFPFWKQEDLCRLDVRIDNICWPMIFMRRWEEFLHWKYSKLPRFGGWELVDL